MNLTEVLITAILKKGLLYESKNVDTNVDIPITLNNKETNIKINIKCDNMVLRIDKDEKKGV